MASPPRRFLFDLNVAQEEPDEWDEPEEAVEQERAVAEPEEDAIEEVVEEVVEEAVEPEEVIMDEEEPVEEVIMEEEEEVAEEEVIMGEDEGAAAAAAAAAEAVEEEEREGRRKRKDYEVFVGGLPLDAAEEDVKRALAEAGEVEEVRLARDPADSKLNRGFAFVRFAAAWEARWAANDLRTATVLVCVFFFMVGGIRSEVEVDHLFNSSDARLDLLHLEEHSALCLVVNAKKRIWAGPDNYPLPLHKCTNHEGGCLWSASHSSSRIHSYFHSRQPC